LDYIAIAVIAIFVTTLYLINKRPWDIKQGYAVGIGALVSLLLGTVSLGQAVGSSVHIWDALVFIGIVAFSVVLDGVQYVD
jgi:Na+/H+ antiporter NhaD/arsenite permease-like protein